MTSASKAIASTPCDESALPSCACGEGLQCVPEVPSFTAGQPATWNAAVVMYNHVLTVSTTVLTMTML